MARGKVVIAVAALGLLAARAPAQAWDGSGPFAFLFHRYGDDMYQPALTEARPYWHGDDAVPPALRWHDREIEIVDEYGFTVATRVPPPEVLPRPVVLPPPIIDAPLPAPARRHHGARRSHRRVKTARPFCPPSQASSVAVVVPAAEPVVLRPPVPAPTEH